MLSFNHSDGLPTWSLLVSSVLNRMSNSSLDTVRPSSSITCFNSAESRQKNKWEERKNAWQRRAQHLLPDEEIWPSPSPSHKSNNSFITWISVSERDWANCCQKRMRTQLICWSLIGLVEQGGWPNFWSSLYLSNRFGTVDLSALPRRWHVVYVCSLAMFLWFSLSFVWEWLLFGAKCCCNNRLAKI